MLSSFAPDTALVLLGIYLLPTIIAFGRRHPQRWAIWVVNTFLGWTLIGWVVALAMSVSAIGPPRPETEGSSTTCIRAPARSAEHGIPGATNYGWRTSHDPFG